MSTLFEGEELVSLEEALAFIDSFEGEESAPSSSPSESPGLSSDPGTPSSDVASSSPSPSEWSGGAEASPVAAAFDVPRPATINEASSVAVVANPKSGKNGKKRSAASSSTVIQRRKRAELATLRKQVVQLEAQVAHLKNVQSSRSELMATSSELYEKLTALAMAGADVIDTARFRGSAWQQLAALQARERHRSELTNRKLKAILHNQQKVNDAFRAVLGKRNVLQGMELIFDSQPVHRPPAPVDSSAAMLSQLEKQVESLYIGMGPKPPSDLPKTVSCTTQFKHNQVQGRYIEVTTTTPYAGSIHEAAYVMWQKFAVKRKYPHKTYRSMRVIGGEALEKDYVTMLWDDTTQLSLHALQFTRKFIESDRIVIVRTSVMFLPTNGLQFRDRTWITISKLDSDNGLASVVESRYQVNAETVDGAVGVATSSEDLSSTQEYVMQQLSGHLRAFDQTLQTELLTVESSQRQLLGFKC